MFMQTTTVLIRSWTSSPINRLPKAKRLLAKSSGSILLPIAYNRKDKNNAQIPGSSRLVCHLVHYSLVNTGNLTQCSAIIIQCSGEATEGNELFHVSQVFIAVTKHLRKTTEK